MNLKFLKVATRQAAADMERMRDVEIADLVATAFGAWACLIASVFVLSGATLGLLTGVLPGLTVFLLTGINVYRARHGMHGFERPNQVSILIGAWMIAASAALDTGTIIQFSNTFSGMWIAIASAYAGFLRQNDRNRETVLLFKLPGG